MAKTEFLLLALLWSAISSAQSRPLEGKWRGAADAAETHVNFAFEFKRDKHQAMTADFYQDNLGYYAVGLGEVKDGGQGHFTIPGAGLKLHLVGSSLTVTGLLDVPAAAVEFAATESLPSLSSLPELPTGPGPTWQLRLGGAIYAPAARRDGFAYLGNIDGVFYAIKVADGTVAWTFAAGRPIYGEALITAAAVYFVCDNGYLYKISRTTGKALWRYDLGDGRVPRIPPSARVFDYDRQSPRPLLIEGNIYVGAGDGGFHAVRADNGTRLWRVAVKGKIRTTAVAHGPNIIFTTAEGADHGAVVAVARNTGKRVWTYDAAAPVTTAPSIAGDVLIAGTRGANTRLFGLDARSGAVRWSQYYWGSWVESEAVVTDGSAYIGSGDLFTVTNFDPLTGHNLWRTDVYGWVLARPAVTQNSVYAGVASAHRNFQFEFRQLSSLTKLDRHTGKIIWRWPMTEWPGAFLNGFIAAPSVAADLVLIGGVNGSLYAFPAD